MVKSYKFGILFCKEGQTREEEMFSNVHGNEAFETFLTFLGQKVVLKGWEGYRGGLDARNDSTGTHSIYSTYSDFEIMFHVSTYLPYTPENPQQLERKRHLGNDIVVLVFKEGNTPYVPNTITSEFNRTYLATTLSTYYRLTKHSCRRVYRRAAVDSEWQTKVQIIVRFQRRRACIWS